MVRAPGQQNRGEDPSFTQCSLLSPALSVEAWDPAITSAWVRLLPLPGSAPSTVPGSTCQGPSWSSRPFEGTPTTLAWSSHLHPSSPPHKRAIGPLVLPGSSLQTGCPRAWPLPPWCAHSSRDPFLHRALGPSTRQVSSKPLLPLRAKAATTTPICPWPTWSPSGHFSQPQRLLP